MTLLTPLTELPRVLFVAQLCCCLVRLCHTITSVSRVCKLERRVSNRNLSFSFFRRWWKGACQVSHQNTTFFFAKESHRIGHQTRLSDISLIAHSRKLLQVSSTSVLCEPHLTHKPACVDKLWREARPRVQIEKYRRRTSPVAILSLFFVRVRIVCYEYSVRRPTRTTTAVLEGCARGDVRGGVSADSTFQRQNFPNQLLCISLTKHKSFPKEASTTCHLETHAVRQRLLPTTASLNTDLGDVRVAISQLQMSLDPEFNLFAFVFCRSLAVTLTNRRFQLNMVWT